MEIELKYVFDDPAIVDQLFSDEKIRAARDQKAE